LAGPNGAGKSTSAPWLLKDSLKVTDFVNADIIARGLSAFEPERAALPAGRVMLGRIKELARSRASFAFETTLASRTFAPWIEGLIRGGYVFHLVFLWLRDSDLAVTRVADRVRKGGHSVPTPTIRRRYVRGLRNFFEIYRPLSASWLIYDSSGPFRPRPVAGGQGRRVVEIMDRRAWTSIEEQGIG
jgi:predicted ABC-type ATPase